MPGMRDVHACLPHLLLLQHPGRGGVHPQLGQTLPGMDSCQLDQFATVAGGHDFRKSRASRQRHVSCVSTDFKPSNRAWLAVLDAVAVVKRVSQTSPQSGFE